MTWADLFERGSETGTTLAAVRAALAARREGDTAEGSE